MTVEVPDVVATTADQAQEALKALGLTVEFDAGADSVVRASNWTVTAQSPTGGTAVEESASVTLTVVKTDDYWPDQKATEYVSAVTASWKQHYAVSEFAQVNEDSETPFIVGYVSEITSPSGRTIDAKLSEGAPVPSVTELEDFAYNQFGIISQSNELDRLTVTTADGITATVTTDRRPAATITPSGLDNANAQDACRQYGERENPYGFNPAWLTGNLNQSVQGDAWFLKVEAAVTNQYGAEAKLTMECTVGGTNDSPTVTSFLVY